MGAVKSPFGPYARLQFAGLAANQDSDRGPGILDAMIASAQFYGLALSRERPNAENPSPP